jgi:hypothetical protein
MVERGGCGFCYILLKANVLPPEVGESHCLEVLPSEVGESHCLEVLPPEVGESHC